MLLSLPVNVGGGYPLRGTTLSVGNRDTIVILA